MRLLINGKEQNVNNEKLTISQILKTFEIENPDMVSVQLNREFIRKEKYAEIFVKEDDEIDFLYFMGGGR